ncbi:MAG: hypothetical protein R3E31_16230 [Chloroflexota bacterium]
MPLPQQRRPSRQRPYGLEAALVGREEKRLLLDDWFLRDPAHPLLAVIGLGGQGKNAPHLGLAASENACRRDTAAGGGGAFTRRTARWTTVAAVLAHFGDEPRQFATLREAVMRFLQHLQRHPVLLLLDGSRAAAACPMAWGPPIKGMRASRRLASEHARQCVHPVAGHLRG